MASAKTQEILTLGGQAYVALMQSHLPSVTGKTKASVKYEVSPNRLRGLARAFTSALETGRGPRKSSSYSEFDKGLEEWLQAKGFQTKKTASGKIYYNIHGKWFSAKGLAWKINKDGDKTWRSGGKEVYTQALEKMINDLMKALEDQKLQETRKELLKIVNGTLGTKTA